MFGMVTHINWTCTYCINAHHTQSFTWHIIKDKKILYMWCRKSRYTLCTGLHIKIYYTLCLLDGHASPAWWACITRSMGMYCLLNGHLPTNRSFQGFQSGHLQIVPRVSYKTTYFKGSRCLMLPRHYTCLSLYNLRCFLWSQVCRTTLVSMSQIY